MRGKRMRVGIHQLHYLPWLRYFEKIQNCDVFVVLDDIQFNKNGWQNRNKVKTPSGPVLLTVPVQMKFQQRLDEVRLDNRTQWRKKHWKTIEQSYHRAPHFSEYAGFFEATYAREWEFLNELNRHMLEFYLRTLGVTTRVEYSSALNVPGIATERLVNLIRAVGGESYYSGAYALDAYLDAEALAQAGITLDLQEWRAPVYPQLHGEFVPDLSIVDLMMNCGPESLGVVCGQLT
jgi:hypothetical protein